ncbi:MAG: 5-formyltetrahydrofolate cyclo-ligase [Clostridia bacterium]
MKKEFRDKVISTRKNQHYEFISDHSSIIIKKLLSMECIQNSKNIMLYLDFNNEVQTSELVNKLIGLKKIVYSPITITKERKLIPCRITNLEDNIKIGAYGIREPKKDCYPSIDISDIDIVIVPAVAYDKNRYRLGYGGGYYDRFLNNSKNSAITIGIAFDFQIFDEIPKESHDAQLDYIITETTILSYLND